MNIFVAKLNFDTRESDLQNAFEAHGAVDSVKIIMDKMTGRSKGFGFVEMPSDDEGQSAIDALNDQDFDGRTIVVKKAEPRENRGGGGGYGGGGGNRGGGGGYGGGGGGRY
ncbi:MAG: RNA recognition motif-containing protein [Gammaproteobacteria bacterium]|jgi:RNA recognition motif-containing protein